MTALDDAGRGVVPGLAPVPYTAPGDRVVVGADGVAVEALSPHRAEPPCPLFGRCGGCSVQHLADDLYAEWKAARVARALAAAGVPAPMTALRRSPLASRRRATFTATRRGGRFVFGYHGRRSHEVVDVASCPALAPELNAALPALRALAGETVAARGEARLTATLCDNGVDAALSLPRAAPAKRGRGRRRETKPAPLMLASEDPAIVRITADGETLLMREAPAVRFAGSTVTPPPGAFLQATREGEAALMRAVTEAAQGAARVADLFCGIGTFALPLARHASVLAVEGDAAAVAALEAAARPAGAKPLAVQRRNLFAHPLSAKELSGFDAVVFDPPRAGAAAQAHVLAGSDVPTVVAVSCEPATLARDCAILREGGYTITQVTPVDQFVASAHIEAVAVLRRTP